MLPKNYSLRKILVVFSFFEIYCTRVGNSERFSQGKLWNFTANTNRRLELGTTFGVFFLCLQKLSLPWPTDRENFGSPTPRPF